jgi:endonuclease/exonuclease/phosphatase (EEP) superfamily protein YafD
MTPAPPPRPTLAGAFALAVGATALIGGVLGQAGRFSPSLDVFAHFAPFWLLGAALTVVPGALLAGPRFRGASLVLGSLGLLAAGGLMLPELRRPASAAATSADQTGAGRLRLIQYNAWEDNPSPQAAADWIAAQNPDVVTVEELSPALRAALIGHGFQFRRGMTKEIGIFSRAPSGRAMFIVPNTEWPVLPEFARGQYPAPGLGGVFDLVAVHMVWPIYHDYGFRAAALARLVDRYHSDRVILAGDFNTTPWSFALRGFDRRLGLARLDQALPTWPERVSLAGVLLPAVPVLPIDHVYAGSAWRVLSLRRGPALGSDHAPLVIDLAPSRPTLPLVRPGPAVFIAGSVGARPAQPPRS